MGNIVLTNDCSVDVSALNNEALEKLSSVISQEQAARSHRRVLLGLVPLPTEGEL